MTGLREEMGKYREDFPILKEKVRGKPLVYLDSAATAQKPQSLIDAISNFYSRDYGTVHRAVYALAARATDSYAAVRSKVRAFLSAGRDEEIVFTRGTTEAINLVASSFGKEFIQPGDEVLVSTICHHSNIVPWQMMCEARGAKVRVIPCDDRGVLDLEAYKGLLNEKTRMVAVTHVANSIGTINPIKEMTQMAHEVGARFLADGAQSVPHMPVDVQDLGVDFYAFSGHKALGPTGIGCLYAKYDFLHQLPPYQGGGDMIDRVTFEKTTYNDPPLKFEAGTPAIAQVIGLGAAIDYLQSVGMDKLHQWEGVLLAAGTKRLQAIDGLRIIGTAPEKGGILSFVVDGVHHLDIGTLLDLKGIAVRTGHHCTQPAMDRFGVTGTVRASFCLYNTLEEVEYFADCLEQVIRRLRD